MVQHPFQFYPLLEAEPRDAPASSPVEEKSRCTLGSASGSGKIESGLYISSHTSENGFRNPKHYDRPSRYSNVAGNATTRVTVTLPETNPTVASTYDTAQAFKVRYLRTKTARA